MPDFMRAPFALGEPVDPNLVACATYRLPPHQPHVSELMQGTVLPKPRLLPHDKPSAPKLWHQKQGGGPHHHGRGGGRDY